MSAKKTLYRGTKQLTWNHTSFNLGYAYWKCIVASNQWVTEIIKKVPAKWLVLVWKSGFIKQCSEAYINGFRLCSVVRYKSRKHLCYRVPIRFLHYPLKKHYLLQQEKRSRVVVRKHYYFFY